MAIADRTTVSVPTAVREPGSTSKLVVVALIGLALLPYWCLASALLNSVHVCRQLAGIR